MTKIYGAAEDTEPDAFGRTGDEHEIQTYARVTMKVDGWDE